MPRVCDPQDAQHLLAPGYNPRHALKWVAKTLLTPQWFLAGSPIQRLPSLQSRVESRMMEVRDKLFDAVAPVALWSPQTKSKVQELFFRYQEEPREAFYDAITREVPEAHAGLPYLRNVFENIWTEYAGKGMLADVRKVTNYFPVVRDRRKAVGSAIMEVEICDSYFPQTIENLISPRDPFWVKGRKVLDPSAFPRKISFDDTLKLYFTQYARHKALTEYEPLLNDMLKGTPDELMDYTADLVNFWLGRRDPRWSNQSGMWSDLRKYQFTRTIGGSILSPFVNTLQRLNTWSVVSTPSFLGAFDDMKDPHKLELLKKAGITDLLSKVDVDDQIGGGAFSQFAQKLMRGAGKMFEVSERRNRMHAFFAGLREAEKKGIEGEGAFDFARDVMNTTQFVQTRANLPPAFRSEFGRTLGQFQTFRINQTHFMARLVQEAEQGTRDAISNGDSKSVYQSVVPLIKYLTGSMAIGGSASLTLGDWGEEKLTRLTLGRASRIPGFPEMLGVNLKSQMALGSINADDVNSFLFFLPGPTASFIQAIIGTGLGFSAGRGADLTKIGDELTTEQRVRMLQQLLPAGIQFSRFTNALKLLQTDGEFRRAIDPSEAWGISPASGETLSAHAADAANIIATAAGFPNADRLEEFRRMERMRDMEKDRAATMAKSADFIAAGRYDLARKTVESYNKRSVPLGGVMESGPSAQSLKNAYEKRYLPPGRRSKPPKTLQTAEPFTGTKPYPWE